jgi:hypothetical protein
MLDPRLPAPPINQNEKNALCAGASAALPDIAARFKRSCPTTLSRIATTSRT